MHLNYKHILKDFLKHSNALDEEKTLNQDVTKHPSSDR